jgi:hypothetical protein
MSDFIPALVSIAIVAASFLLVWNLDVRNVRRVLEPEQTQTEDAYLSRTEDAEPF